MTERPTLALQENILALLAYSDEHGKIIANMVDPTLFEGDYRQIAERCRAFWLKHNSAPKLHTFDLMADLLEDKTNRRAPILKRIIQELGDLAKAANAEYVIRTAMTFTKLQRYKQAVLQMGQRINAQEDVALDEVEGIMSQLLRTREINFSAGMRLTDMDEVIASLERRKREFSSGVALLDNHFIVPARGNIFLPIGGKGVGKTWLVIGAAKRALRKGQKVLHISLEMDEPFVMQRYYQALFAIPKRKADFYSHTSLLIEEEQGRDVLVGFEDDEYTPDFTFAARDVRTELTTRIDALGVRMDNLRVKRFPAGQLTLNGLMVYLDNLDTIEHFVPDLFIMDYPRLMKIDTREFRLNLGQLFVDLRAVLAERNMAGVFPHQSSRKGVEAQMIRATHAGEDYSLIQTADTAVTVSATDPERQVGLARLFVEHCREEKDHWGCLITQDYEIGQFCLDAVMLPKDYFTMLRDHTGMDVREDDDITRRDRDD